MSYLAQLTLLNGMQITEQVRKAANAWRRNKEASNAAFLDLTSDVCLHIKREEVISNARTNWELLRSQTKCLANKTPSEKLESDFVLKTAVKVPVLTEKKIKRTSSQESQNTGSSSSGDYFRLPPILVPIINKIEQKSKISDNSSVSSAASSDSEQCSSCNEHKRKSPSPPPLEKQKSETNSEISVNTAQTNTSSSGSVNSSKLRRNVRNVRSATNTKTVQTKKQVQTRAVTAKPKKQASPVLAPVNKDREQGNLAFPTLIVFTHPVFRW